MTWTPPKLYRHYKGHHYLLMAIVDDSTDISATKKPTGRKYAIYYSLERGQFHVREWWQFAEPMQWPDGFTRNRFTAVEELEKEGRPARPKFIVVQTDGGFVIRTRGAGTSELTGSIEDATDLRDRLVNWLGAPRPEH